MRCITLISIIILNLFSITLISYVPQPAITTVPVADLLGDSLAAINKEQGTHLTYQTLALCGKPAGTYACPRIHQLLFNEEVEIVDENISEYKVKIPNLFFVTTEGNTLHATYWTSKKNLTKISTLAQQGVDLSLLPQPITMQQGKKSVHPAQQIVTLTHPYYDPTTHVTFSAGTRFVRASAQDDHIVVYVLNPKNMHIQKITLPLAICLDNSTLKTAAEKIKKFVKIARSWTQQQGFIPYVWGGCSFVHTAHNPQYTEQAIMTDKKKEIGHIWVLTGYDQPIKTGVDCAGLISRTAQICGIPYFFKNSITAATFLEQRGENELPKSGDIIWLPMHVMIVGDVKKNTMIEARIYAHGYGKVHEIPLHKAFKGIHTFAQLAHAIKAQKPLLRLDTHGNVVQTVVACKILNMESAWKFLS